MKKYIFLTSLLSFLIAAPAYASTLSVTPTTVNVTAGQTVSLTVTAQGGTATLVTIDAQLSYTASILQPVSFNFAPTWIPLTQTGYDQMSGGTVIKTGGYPGGFTGNKVLGTLTFTATHSGVATVSVTNGSLAYDQSSSNTLSGTQGSATVNVSAASQNQTTGTGTTVTGTTTNNGAANSAAVANALGSTTASTTNGVDQAAAAGLLGLGIPSWVWWLLLLIVIVLAGGSWWYWGNKKA
jgi:hypothetical protein